MQFELGTRTVDYAVSYNGSCKGLGSILICSINKGRYPVLHSLKHNRNSVILHVLKLSLSSNTNANQHSYYGSDYIIFSHYKHRGYYQPACNVEFVSREERFAL